MEVVAEVVVDLPLSFSSSETPLEDRRWLKLEPAVCYDLHWIGKRKQDRNGHVRYQNEDNSLPMTIRQHCPRPNSPAADYLTNGMAGNAIVSLPA